MAGEFHQQDFVESLFYQNVGVSPALYDYVSTYKLDDIDHVATSYYTSAYDEKLINLTLECVEPLFIQIGKKLNKTGFQVLRMWIQKYGAGQYHPIHTHSPDAFHFSFAYYIDCTENSSCIMFYNIGYPYVDHTNFKLQPVKGLCVVFPGGMPHEAMPNKDDRRLIVSGNIFYFDKDKFPPQGRTA